MPEVTKTPRRRRGAAVFEPEAVDVDSDRRTPPAAEVLPPRTTVRSDDADPDVPNQLRFFNFLRQVEDWSKMAVYLYRLEPKVQNAGRNHSIDVLSNWFDERYIKSAHGGGKYQAILNDVEQGKTIRKCIIEVAGTPKLKPDQVMVGAGGEIIAGPDTPLPGGAPMPAPQATEISALTDVVTKALNMVAEQKKSPDDALKMVLDQVSIAQKASMEILAEAAKRQASSQTGNPLLDKILENSITKLTGEASARSNPMGELKTMLETVREMQELTGEKRRGGVLEELKGVAEILKTDTDGTLKGLIFGRGGEEAEPAGFGAKAFDLAKAAITEKPEIVGALVNVFNSFASWLQRPAVLPPQPPALPPAPLAGIPPAVAAPTIVTTQTIPLQQPSAPAAPPQGLTQEQREQIMIQSILISVANGYSDKSEEESPRERGAAVADALCRLHPEAIALLEQYIGLPDAMIVMWLRSQAVLAPIVDQPDFAEFFAGFKAALAGEEPGPDSGASTTPGPRIV